MQDADKQIRICPGCHIACNLEAYMCARGKDFHARWHRGEDIPTSHQDMHRRNAQQARREGKEPPSMTSAHLLMFMLNVVANTVLKRSGLIPTHRVLSIINMHQGMAMQPVLVDRTMFDEATVNEAIEELLDARFVEYAADDSGRNFIRLTDAGNTQVAIWDEERVAEDEEMLAELSEEDRKQMLELIGKFLAPTRKKPV